MGTCASVQKDSDSCMKMGLSESKAKKLLFSSPAKEKTVNGGQPVVVGFSSKRPDFGSKEEVFFDSQAWLDSDCDDDFMSVNGDFTPPRGCTPIHPISGASTPKMDSSLFTNYKLDYKPEPSPTGRKKLSELFNESLRSEFIPETRNFCQVTTGVDFKPDVFKTQSEQPVKSVNGTPHRSGTSSAPSTETTPNRSIKNKKEKTWKTANCCLPSLQNFGYDERRQKMSPEILAA